MTVSGQLEANKKVARDYIDQVFNRHNPGRASDFVTSDVVRHGGGLGDIAGVENLVGLLGSFIGALPDLYAAEQDIVAENDLVLVRLVVTATVKGSLLGVPADGKPVRWTAYDVTGSPMARSARSGPAMTLRRSWSRSVPSTRRGPPTSPHRQPTRLRPLPR